MIKVLGCQGGKKCSNTTSKSQIYIWKLSEFQGVNDKSTNMVGIFNILHSNCKTKKKSGIEPHN